MQSQHHVYLNAASDAEARQLDELLWTFSQGSFIPHRVVTERLTEPPDEPVLIGIDQPATSDSAADTLPGDWDLMINLATEVPEFFSRYARVVEVIDADPVRRERGRAHYRFYRDRGYDIGTHNV